MKLDRESNFPPALEGCLVGFFAMAVTMLALTLLPRDLWKSNPTTLRLVRLWLWLIAVALAGFHATKRGRKGDFTHAWSVGLIACIFALGRGSGDKLLTEFVSDLMRNPREHWWAVATLALTIPAALMGGKLYRRKNEPPNDIPIATH